MTATAICKDVTCTVTLMMLAISFCQPCHGIRSPPDKETTKIFIFLSPPSRRPGFTVLQVNSPLSCLFEIFYRSRLSNPWSYNFGNLTVLKNPLLFRGIRSFTHCSIHGLWVCGTSTQLLVQRDIASTRLDKLGSTLPN